MIGKTVSHYKVLEKLGEGGMGVVYLAEDTKLYRKVALKFLLSHGTADPEALKRFQREARVIAALNHPNIVTIYEIGEFDGKSFIAMEYVEGQSLRKMIESHASSKSETDPIALDDVLDISIQMCEGLHEAHKAEIVHRDLKPENVILDQSGTVKILDFGLAKLKSLSNLTQEPMALGTANYMSPEQLQGLAVDNRSDIWSFCISMYELLTCTHPFQSDYEQATLYSILHEDPLPLSEKRTDSPPELQQIVDKCLQKEPENRPRSFLEIKSALQEIKNKTKASSAELSPIKSASSKSTAKMILGTVSGLILVFFILANFPTFRNWWSVASIPDEKHLVVLPFDNISKVEADRIFCDGLVETITSKLTAIEMEQDALWVVPAVEIRNRNIKSISEARKVFNANLVITGSFQHLGEQIRLTMNLVDARKIRQLKSVILTSQLDKTHYFQDSIVNELSILLSLELAPSELASLNEGATQVPGAWEFYIQGRGYLQRWDKEENIESAIKLFTQALAHDSLYALAHEGLALAYWYKYDAHKKNERWYHLALQECETALKLDSRQANIRVTAGQIYYGTSQYQKAQSEFLAAIAINAKNTDAYIFLAKSHEKLGKYKEAEETFKAAIRLKPDYWISYNSLGIYYLNQGQFDNAVVQYKQVTKLTPDNFGGFNNLGGTYLRTGQLEEARQMFKRSIEINPNYPAYSNLGILYYFQQDYPKAVAAYEQALELNDSDYRVWANLADGYTKSGSDSNKVIEIYKIAVMKAEEKRVISPNDPDLLADLAGYYADLGKKEKAAELIGKVLANGTADVFVMYLAGYIYEKIGQRESAIEWVCKALESGYPKTELEQDNSMARLRLDGDFKCLQMASNP